MTRFTVFAIAAVLLAAAPARAGDGPEPFDFAVFASGNDRPCAADVNGDGYADLLAFTPGGDVWVALSDHGQKCHGGSVWLHGFGAGETPAAAADLDGDGRTDVVEVAADGTIRVGVSDGKGEFVVAAWKCADVAAVASLATSKRTLLAVDIDGDGLADLVFLPKGPEPGEVTWLHNTGLHAFDKPARWGTATGDALAADFDGDRRADFAWWRDGKVFVARGSTPEKVELWGEGLPGPLHAAGDVNGDGKADLVARGAWLLSHGQGFVSVPDGRLRANNEAVFSVGDIDADGDGDVFLFERVGECNAKGILSRQPHWSAPEVWCPGLSTISQKNKGPLVPLPGARALVGGVLLEGDGKLGVKLPRETSVDTQGVQAVDFDGHGHTALFRVRDGRLERGEAGNFQDFAAAPSPLFAVAPWEDGGTAIFFPDRALLFQGHETWERSLGGPFAHRELVNFAALPLTTPGKPDLIAFETSGTVLVAPRTGNGWALAEPWALEPANAKPRWLADLTRDGRADLVAEVPGGLAVLAGDARLHAFRQIGPIFRGPGKPLGLADLTGDGIPELLLEGPAGDLLVARLGGSLDRDADGIPDRDEVRIYGSDPDKRDTDGDGLLDGWEVHGFRGVRLDRMGASPVHKDIFLELDVEQTADMARVDRAIKRCERLFGDAPIENLDGKGGIAFHGFVDTRVPLWPDGDRQAPSRQEFREMFFTPRRAGMFHWMHLGARGGGGQADMWADQGSCAGVFECVLPHEFGHQIGLNHGGGVGTNGIPVYPSLMNYAYNYDQNFGYSAGTLAGLNLDENALPEVIDAPFEKLRYLSGGPFHFRVEALEGGKKTWVDWNRDGVCDQKPVKANINAVAGDGYGPREILDNIAAVNTLTATEQDPMLVDADGALTLLWVQSGPKTVAARVLPANDDDPHHFGPVKTVLDVAGLTDPVAVAVGKEIHVFGTRPDGLVIEAKGTIEKGLEVAAVVSTTPGLEAGAVVRKDRVRVFLRAPDGTISCEGATIPGLVSSTPPGLAWDTKKDQLLLVTTDDKTNRLHLCRLDPETIAVVSSEQVGGPHGTDATNRRPAVAFETSEWLPPEGRVDIFHAAILGAKLEGWNTHMYRSYSIGDKAWLGRNGWKEDMTWNEWSYSSAAPAIALRHGRPWKVDRFWGGESPLNDRICVAWEADGICDADMHDHDDWALIRDKGLERSILHVSEPRGRLSIGK
jgi:hypothetical protein